MRETKFDHFNNIFNTCKQVIIILEGQPNSIRLDKKNNAVHTYINVSYRDIQFQSRQQQEFYCDGEGCTIFSKTCSQERHLMCCQNNKPTPSHQRDHYHLCSPSQSSVRFITITVIKITNKNNNDVFDRIDFVRPNNISNRLRVSKCKEKNLSVCVQLFELTFDSGIIFY